MPTLLTHNVVAAASGKIFFPKRLNGRFLALSVLCSGLPDLDVVGFFFGIQYGDVLGHRGFSHSLMFAFILAIIVVMNEFKETRIFSGSWWRLAAYFFLLTASHGVLDAFTDGGLGIAFFSPFDNTRYFFPWTPLHVSPIGLLGFFTEYGGRALWSEFLWVCLPLLFLVLSAIILRRRASVD